MKNIVIVGSGFSGIATAVQLIHQFDRPASLTLINPGSTFATGIAYQPYATMQLLNVNAAKMSLFPDQPEHFLDWVMQQAEYTNLPRHFVAQAFLPRALYGQYLQAVWQQSLELAQSKTITVQQLTAEVTGCIKQGQQFRLTLDNTRQYSADILLLANGNHLPGNRVLPDASFASSPNYIQNPWQPVAPAMLHSNKPVLIIGNGLTMVDTVLSLKQQGVTQPIIALSRHGYTMLAHRHNGLHYPDFSTELLAAGSLRQLVGVVRKHIRSVRQLGISAEPVVDAIRPYTQQLWRRLSVADKRKFLARVRHLWGVARHRLPIHIYDKIQQLRLNGSLQLYAGQLVALQQQPDGVLVQFIEKKTSQRTSVSVSAVINCTGPETDLRHLPAHFLHALLMDGTIRQDPFQLGIVTDVDSFAVTDSNGKPHSTLFAIGSNLKGELWESTAVNELRSQAQRLASRIIQQLATASGN